MLIFADNIERGPHTKSMGVSSGAPRGASRTNPPFWNSKQQHNFVDITVLNTLLYLVFTK